jgi:hypothetical protein
MVMKRLPVLILIASSVCWGQSEFKVPLVYANPARALPLLAAGDGVLYVAYRAWTWARNSNRLELVAYDLNTQKELRHATLPVPEVYGTRAADGLYLSPDGQTLAYAELHDPCLLLLISARDLNELRRSTSLSFVEKDPTSSRGQGDELFAGFDGRGLLSIALRRPSKGVRLVRIDPAQLKVISSRSTAKGKLGHDASESLVWSPAARRVWTTTGGGAGPGWIEFTEDGKLAGAGFAGPQDDTNGADALGEGKLLTFYGGSDQGTVISYHDGRQDTLDLPCAPSPFGISNDPGYAGALCFVSHPTIEQLGKPTAAEFLLLNTQGPSVMWCEKDISLIETTETDEHDREFYQKGHPLIYRAGKKVYVIAPSTKPELTTYVVSLPD